LVPELQAARAPATPDEVVGAVAGFRGDAGRLQAMLELQPMPIYLTDADGWVTFFNRACIDFAGRTPVAGEDRWCVTWRLHTESGAVLPHEECPMATALRDRRAVRGAVAVAERPDGTRVLFTPYPTPIFGDDGRLEGAVNALIDVTDQRQAGALKAQARRCRRLAQTVSDTRTVATLKAMAVEYDEKARALVAD
jgi:PAS domain-containing protein